MCTCDRMYSLVQTFNVCVFVFFYLFPNHKPTTTKNYSHTRADEANTKFLVKTQANTRMYAKDAKDRRCIL